MKDCNGSGVASIWRPLWFPALCGTIMRTLLMWEIPVVNHVREGKATCLTRDHTWVGEQRKLGIISAVEADGSDNANAQVISVRSIEPMGMYRGRLYPLSES